jgi:hypothetical protein
MQHPLEHNSSEQAYFAGTLTRSGDGAHAAYRRAVEVLTGSLPTWASRAKPGRKPGAHRHAGE